MRITGGKYLNRRIKCPPGIIRPAMDRMRESMFSILGNIEGKSFLDLFSGSGCIGIEAASRGAGPVHLVEKDFSKKKIIMENISFVENEIRLFTIPAERYIKNGSLKYDIIHLDPPFNYKNKLYLLELISDSLLMEEGCIIMMHYPSGEKYPEKIRSLFFRDKRKYGGSELIFYSFSNH